MDVEISAVHVTRHASEQTRRLKGGCLFVWTPDEQRGWIVKVEGDVVTVITTLSRTGIAAA